MGFVGKAVKGLLGGNSAPAPQDVNLSPDTEALIQKKIAQSQSSDEDILKEQLAGVTDRPKPQFGDSVDQARMLALGNQQPSAFTEALNRRASKNYERDINKLSREAQANLPSERLRREAAAEEGVSLKNQISMQNQQNRIDAENNRRAARGSIIRSATGIAGGVAGAVVGGPAGAAVGFQAGQAIGGGLSGNNAGAQPRR